MAPGRLAGLLQAAEAVAVRAETTRDMLLALLSFTPEFDGAVLTTEVVSLYFQCIVNLASLSPPHGRRGVQRDVSRWHSLM